MADHTSSSLSQPGLALPNQSFQNQIHELAKTLPPPRKQNTACDACRSRKVKCNRLPGQDKCQHCLSKNYPCTHYVQQATSEKKRASVPRRRNLSSTSSSSPGPSKITSPTLENNTPAFVAGAHPYSAQSYSHSHAPSPYAPNPYVSPIPGTTTPPAAPFPIKYGFYPPITTNTPTKDLLLYLFSPPAENHSSDSAYSGTPRTTRAAYSDWGDQAYKLESETFRAEFALDLVEVFFQIVHTRLPLLNPANFRRALGLQPPTPTSPAATTMATATASPISPTSMSPTSSTVQMPSSSVTALSTAPNSGKPLHPALVATVLAWGAKFSEHPLLVADRQHNGVRHVRSSSGSGSTHGAGYGTAYGQSRLARTLIDRAREIAEALKVHRVPTADHVVIGLLIEPLQSQNPDDPQGYHGFWLTAATRHLLDLGINHKSVMSNIQDPEERGTMIFAWWMTCICDAYAAAYYRRKPVLDDDDYDIDFYTAVDSGTGGSSPSSGSGDDIHHTQGGPTPSPRDQLEFLGYYRAAHALARLARNMSRQLWRPVTEADGIPFDVLSAFTTGLVEWRESYLPMVGVPSNFEGEWDFVSAVSSCASDATYHVMWIILFGALDDFGVREANEVVRIGNVPSQHLPNYTQIESVKRKVMEEALHGALRIAGLAGVLTSNGYLRLDPAVMHVSCINAGTLLARLGRPEVSNCIAGLEQYSYSYEEAGDQAIEINHIYRATLAGESHLNHMAAVNSRPGVSANGPSGSPRSAINRDTVMTIDEDSVMGDSERSNGFYSQHQTLAHSSHTAFGR